MNACFGQRDQIWRNFPTLAKCKGIWLFFGVTYAVFGKILNLLWQKYTFGQIQLLQVAKY